MRLRWSDYLTRYRGLVESTLCGLQHAACDYGKRHPKGPCDCKFDAPIHWREERPGQTIGVGVLVSARTVGADNNLPGVGERTGCPELRFAIELVTALPRVVSWLENEERIHRSWQTCVCEKCVGFRKALGVDQEGA